MTPIPDATLRLAEALIFASDEPLSAASLARSLGSEIDLDQLIVQLSARQADRGFELVAVGAGWRFQTPADLAAAIQSVQEKPKRIPRVAMEILTLVAYKQPVTRAEIEAIRETALPQKTLDLLLEEGLVRSLGRQPGGGRPILYGTTERFLSVFGLQSLEQLPGYGVSLGA